jgi:hypothetical protein
MKAGTVDWMRRFRVQGALNSGLFVSLDVSKSFKIRLSNLL